MHMQEIQFNHNGTELSESFSITKEQGLKLDSAIWFETIVANNIIEKDYDGEPSKAPRVVRTKTGVLSRTIKYAQNEQELAYLLFVFMAKHELMNKLIGTVEGITKAASDRKLDEMVKKAHDHFKGSMSEEEIESHVKMMIDSALRPLKPFKKLLSRVESSNYDFTLFKAMVDDDDPNTYFVDVVESSADALNNMRKSGMFGEADSDND